MVPNATLATIHLVVCLSGTAVTIISLPPPPPTHYPPLIFTFKSFVQFVPNMSTRYPRTWSPTSSSLTHSSCLVKNELGNPHSSLLFYCILYYTGSSSVNWVAVSCILTATLWDTGFKCKSSTRFMCLIINHFVMYYSNPQVNYMVTVFIRLVIAVVYTLHLLSCSKCFVCLCLFQYRHCFLVGWCTNKC